MSKESSSSWRKTSRTSPQKVADLETGFEEGGFQMDDDDDVMDSDMYQSSVPFNSGISKLKKGFFRKHRTCVFCGRDHRSVFSHFLVS